MKNRALGSHVTFRLAAFALAADRNGRGDDDDGRLPTSDTDAADGFCSLREAILAANSDAVRQECPAGAGADRIVFDLRLPATVTLSADLPAITATVAIRGPGAGGWRSTARRSTGLFVFASADGGDWYLLEDLSVLHGYANTGLGPDGGGAYVGPGDTAIFSRVVVAENVAANGGGGIAVDGLTGLPAQAEIHDSILSGNLSLGAAGGGGLLVVDDSAVEVIGSSIIDNRAEASFGAGAGMVIQRSTVAVQRSTISGNRLLAAVVASSSVRTPSTRLCSRWSIRRSITILPTPISIWSATAAGSSPPVRILSSSSKTRSSPATPTMAPS